MPEKRIYQNKSVPRSNLGEWRSIEFECIFKDDEAIEEFVAYVEGKEYDQFITIKYDGSIEINDESGDEDREVVVSYRVGEERIVKDVCKFLTKVATVNKSCGTHIHFDMRGVEKNVVVKYANRLAKCVPALKTILPKSRRNSSWCRMDVNSFEGHDRYAFVNLLAYNQHKTIEVRGHSGTLNAKKILNWIRICEKIMMGDVELTETIKTPEELVSKFKFGKKLSAFIDDRFKKLNLPPTPPAIPIPQAPEGSNI